MPAVSKREGRECASDWCNRPMYNLKNGLCKNCYEKDRRGTLVDPRLPKPQKPECSFEGCNRPADHQKRQLCITHYAQWWHKGELKPIRHWGVADLGEDRKCNTCQQWKNREENYYRTSRGAFQGECKQCMIKRGQENYQARKLAKAGVEV